MTRLTTIRYRRPRPLTAWQIINRALVCLTTCAVGWGVILWGIVS